MVFGSILQDIKFAFRVLAKARGFTFVAVLTLAVAIGASTAIFSVVDAVLIRPLGYPDAEELVTISLDASGAGVPELPFSDRGYWHFREKNRSFEEFGAYGSTRLALTGDGEPIQLLVGLMTNSAYQVLRASPLRGRLPSEEEDISEGPLVALLSHGLWVSRFGSDPGAIGSTIQLNDQTREVIGIMPPGFAFPSNEIDLWIPRQLNPESENFGGHGMPVIARLRDGATVESATLDAESLIQRFEEAGYGPEWLSNVFTGRAIVRTLKEEIVGDSRQPLLIILGTVLFVLLIACSNVANLFLVRAEGRLRETSVRAALGAGRGRLVRYVLTESVLLALMGGLGGLLLAYAGIRMLVAIGPASIPRLEGVGLSTYVFLFSSGLSVLAGLLFGVLPAMQTGSAKVQAALAAGGRGATAGRERHRARGLLVVTQVAVALVLLVGSGLMVRSFQKLRSVDPGFKTAGVVTFGLRLPASRYADADASTRFFDDLLGRLRALPGVENAGATTTLPFSGGGPVLATEIEEFPTGPDGFPPTFAIRFVTPGYFETMSIPIVSGRTVEPMDHQERLGKLFISASLKEQYWPNTSTMGKRIRAAGTWGEVAGVVGDIHAAGLDAPPRQTIYLPVRDTLDRSLRAMSVAVRASGNPSNLVPLLRREVGALDNSLPLSNIQTMDGLVGDSMSRTSFTMFLLVIAAVVALFLGSVGIYGVISYVVSQRTKEFGVRMALGADSPGIHSLVLKQGMVLAVAGVVVGVAGAALMSRMLTTLLFGISPFDALTFIAGPAVFLGVAVVACIIPAQRAAGILPAEALRSD
ncbi:MAG: ABC transporter permease [Gemmatimonadota bacterium]|nr:MAG: ABC transporter permease [Gemmatimonadota bacterium]